MPTMNHGIGTWYYGKRHIHCRKGVCPFCNRIAELESYDTTHYIVFFYLPLIPLSQKRVLEECPHCRRHRALSLKKWEAVKAQDISQLLVKLREDPDSRDTILRAIEIAMAYQDEQLFDELAGGLAKHWMEDAAIQERLGAAYAYFSRLDEAAAAYRASLAAADKPEVHWQYAMTLLKQGKPEEAARHVQTILEQKVKEQAGLLLLLVEGYQARGMHQEALALLSQCDAAFPDPAYQKEIKRLRKGSERNLESGKPIKSLYLSESGKPGYREGSWTARIPRLVGPVVLLGLLAFYLGSALWIGQARKVYLVSGRDKPYTISINGQEQELRPGVAVPVRIPEGDVALEFRNAEAGLEPQHCRVESSFFSRPFVSRTFVINPDELAFVVWEKIEYAEVALANQEPPQLHTGKVLYSFDRIDYEFVPFPPTVQIEKGQTAIRRGLALLPGPDSETRLRFASEVLDPGQEVAYGKRMLQWDPGDAYALYWLMQQLKSKDQEALAFLGTRLNARPVLVEWHRAWQDLMDKVHPDEDLRPRYRQLVAETKEQPDAVYLLGRASEADPDQADKLIAQAAAADPPCVYAVHSLGWRALNAGRVDDAVALETKALRLAPSNIVIQQVYRYVLLAARNYGPLIQQIRSDQEKPGHARQALLELIRVYAAQGDQAKARATIQQLVSSLRSPEEQRSRQAMLTALEMVVSCGQHDIPGFLKAVAQHPETSQFEPALLRGQLKEAAEHVSHDDEEALVQHALLYLAARKAPEPKLADAEWQKLLQCLQKGSRAERRMGDILAGRRPCEVKQLERLFILPEQKRVLLAVAARRYPEHAQPLLRLARLLDYSPDATSLCLGKVLE